LTSKQVKGIFHPWVFAACRFSVSRVVTRAAGRAGEL